MNILTLVVSVLLLLSYITYTNLDIYRQSEPLKRQTFRILETFTREDEEREARKFYDKLTVSEGNNGVRASSDRKLSLSVLSEEDQEKSDLQEEVRGILKRVMQVLFSERSWFKEMEQGRPSFLDELVGEIEKALKDKRVRKIKDLAELDFQDPLLNEAMYRMLKGNLIVKEGQFRGSLYDVVRLGEPLKIRLYLAERPLLLALFQDPIFVFDIERLRRQIYLKLKPESDRDGALKKALTEDFKALFTMKTGIFYDERFFDFSVSKTAPPSLRNP